MTGQAYSRRPSLSVVQANTYAAITWHNDWASLELRLADHRSQTVYYDATNSTTEAGLLYSLLRCIIISDLTCNREVAGLPRTWSTASNVEQVANLLCAQANSASYTQRDGKWVVATATGWRPSVADWGDGVSASCTVGPTVRYRGQWMAT